MTPADREIHQPLSDVKELRPIPLAPIQPKPLVSILIANYNYARYLRDTLDSVLKQTYQNFEICLCDDGSNDDSVDIMQSYARRDIRVKVSVQANQGVGQALNTAWKLATGQLIALLDADDVWLPTKLEQVVERFEANSQIGMVMHPNTLVSGDLATIYQTKTPEAALASGWRGQDLLNGDLVEMPPCSGLTVRREIAEKILPLNPKFRAQADGVFREQAAMLTSIDSIAEPLTLMRMHGQNITTTIGNPTDLRRISANADLFRLRLSDRERFVKTELGVSPTPACWGRYEGVHWVLAELLLTKQKLDPAMLSRVPSPARKIWWRFLFLCPFGLGATALRSYWGPKSAPMQTGMRMFRTLVASK